MYLCLRLHAQVQSYKILLPLHIFSLHVNIIAQQYKLVYTIIII